MRRGIRPAGVWLGSLLLLLLGVGIPRAGQPAGASRPAASPLSDGAAGPVLIRIATDDWTSLDRLREIGFPPVCVQDGYALAWGPAASIPLARAIGPDVDLLTERRPGHEYAVVVSQGGGRLGRGAPLESLGRVLWHGPRTSVLEYPEGADRPVWESYPFLPFGTRPILRPPPAPLFRISSPAVADPAIAAMIQQVDADTLEARVRRLQDFGTRRSESAQGRQAQQLLHDFFLSCGLTDVTEYDYNSWCDDVVAVQPGHVAPDEIYVIGGHYDSFAFGGLTAPGADDNATGTVGVLEAARILARQDLEATIVYIAFSGEEQGLVGSRAWADRARDQGMDIRAMVNLDMLGYVAPGGTQNLDLICFQESSWLRDFVIETGSVYLPEYPVIPGSLATGNSDHASFSGNGYYSIFFFEDSYVSTPYIHTTQDVVGLSANDFDFMRKNVQVAIASLATLARPLRVRIDHTPLPDPPVAANGYRVLARIQSNAPLEADSLCVRYAVDRGEYVRIPMAAAQDGPDMFAATIPKQAAGRYVQYVIHAQDIEGRVGEDPFEGAYGFVVGLLPVFADSFGTDGGWTVGAEGDSATTGIWVRAVPIETTAQPGTDADGDTSGVCFVTGNGTPGADPGDQDIDGGRTSLTSPRFDLSNAQSIRIDYSLWYVDDTRPDDTLRVFLSNDDGESWTLIDSVGRSERRWRRESLQTMGIFPPPTDRMRLRFVAEDVGGSSLVEAAIDNVVVKAVIVEPEPPVLETRIVSAAPLPMRAGEKGVRIVYDLASDAPPALAVYDLAGRRIVRLRDVPQGVGRHETRWDGRDAAGRTVAAGIYFLRLEIEGGSGSSVRIPMVP
jgi:hypothetical protein